MADIKVKIHTNTDRKSVIVDDSKTPKQVLEAEGVDFSGAQTHLDGGALDTKGMNTSFAALGITESAIMAVVIKTVNR
jgi:hypothetical protein